MTDETDIVQELKKAEEKGLFDSKNQNNSKMKNGQINNPSSSQTKLSQQILLDNIHTQVWFLVDDHTYGAVNEAHARFNGLKKEDLEFKDMYDVFPKEIVDVCRDGNKKVFDLKKPIVSDELVFHHSGEKRIIRIFKNPKFDEFGNVEFVVCSAEDITNLKRTEEKLESANKLLEGTLDSIQDVIGIQKPDHRVLRYNRAGYDLLDATPEDIQGKKCFEMLGRDTPCKKCPTEIALKTKKLEHLEKYVPEMDAYLSCRSNPVLDEDGNVKYIVEQLQDITQRVHREKELKENRRRLELAMSAGEHGFWDWNLDTDEIYFSPRYYTMLGYQPGELPMKKKTWVSLMHPEDKQKVLPKIEQCIQDAEPYEIEFRLKCKNGDWKWISGRGKGFEKDENGVPHRAVGVHIDVTNEKKLKQKIVASERNFRTFFETVDDLMMIGSPDGKIVFTNSAVSEKLGYSAEELEKMNILDVHPKKYRAEAENIFKEMFDGKRQFCPLPLQKKDGGLLPVETRVWFGEWDGKNCIFGISKDLSKQQAALDKFHKLFDNNPALMAVSSLPDRRFVEVNDAFLAKLGYEREEVIGKTSTELNLFVESEKQKQVAEELASKKYIRDIELSVRRKDGKIINGLFSGDIIDNQGEKSFLTVMTDITPQKKAKQELHEKIDVLERYKKVTVDRELKMIELKKEIEKLKKR